VVQAVREIRKVRLERITIIRLGFMAQAYQLAPSALISSPCRVLKLSV